MASIERTAYPRYNRFLTPQEIQTQYTLTDDERAWLQTITRGDNPTLCGALLLKAFQHLGYFPSLDQIPPAIIHHMRTTLQLPPLTTPVVSPRTLYTYYRLIRERLGILTRGMTIRHIAAVVIERSAQVMDNPADLINVALETLRKHQAELPAFSTLDRLVRRVRTLVNRRFFRQIQDRLTADEQVRLNALLLPGETGRSLYHQLKLGAKRATYGHLDAWLEQLRWLDSLGSFAAPLAGIPPLKIQHFAAEAKALDAHELKDMTPPKRMALLVCLIHRAQAKARDALVELFRKRMAAFHKAARAKLERLQLAHQAEIDRVIATFSEVLDVVDEHPADQEVVQRIDAIVASAGGPTKLLNDCEAIRAYSSNNHLGLVWEYYHSYRSLFFRMLDALTLSSTSQDQRLTQAVTYLKAHRARTAKLLPATLDLTFASEQWQRIITVRKGGDSFHVRKHLEACIFSYLAAELKSGDVAVQGSEDYTDYRDQLLPWDECQPLLAAYCQEIGLPATAHAFVADLRKRLAKAAAAVDRTFKKNTSVTINKRGEPVLKRPLRREPTPAAQQLLSLLPLRMPERSLIDILSRVARWTNCTRHFGPLSGADPKINETLDTYVRVLFAYGTNMGPVEAARHMMGSMSAHRFSFLNRRHISLDSLNRSAVDIINLYYRLTLPHIWGEGASVGTDGTKFALAENNPMAEYHFRYRDVGGVAYYHIADNYVAIFSRFIPCGVWEAVYIIEGLLENRSDIQPRKVHADTQGQSTTVFALTHLLGIELLPRIRNWKDLVFYKADARTTYKHIERLFGEAIDWAYLERHWQDLMQVMISIQEGKISSAMLLRKLGHESTKNRLYRVFRELGRVIRTLYLLRYITEPQLRAEITAGTNKVESYNRFVKWLVFGSEATITDLDPEEAEKAIKYGSVLANAVILHNAYDLTEAIKQLIDEGHAIVAEDLEFLSPYMTGHIKRFGDYVITEEAEPPSVESAILWTLPPRKQQERIAAGIHQARTGP